MSDFSFHLKLLAARYEWLMKFLTKVKYAMIISYYVYKFVNSIERLVYVPSSCLNDLDHAMWPC